MSKPLHTLARLDRAQLADDGPLVFTASSTAVNRYGYALRNGGWRLDNYDANPVVLWAHDTMQPPIGRSLTALKDPRLVAEVTFDTDDDLARRVESKYRRGFLSAVSVGFDMVDENGEVLSWWSLSPEKIHDEAYYDLAEISCVPVPGDPKALKQQQRTALAGLGRDLVDLFDEQEHPDGVITADELSAAVRAELTRLGIAIPNPTEPPSPDAAGIDRDAARAVFAAFNLEGTLK